MIPNSLFWANYIRNIIIPQIRALGKMFEERILSAFKGIEEEANRVRDKKWDQLCKISGEDSDPGNLAEVAENAGIEHYSMMKDLKQGIINLFAAAAYHLFEQQLYVIHRKELLSRTEEDNENLFSIKEVINRLSAHGIDIEKFNAWPRLYEELRLVANVVKHADGWSSSELKQKRPEMFSARDLEFRTVFGKWSQIPREVFQPLFGQDFYITIEELRQYIDLIIAFWEEFVCSLENQS